MDATVVKPPCFGKIFDYGDVDCIRCKLNDSCGKVQELVERTVNRCNEKQKTPVKIKSKESKSKPTPPGKMRSLTLRIPERTHRKLKILAACYNKNQMETIIKVIDDINLDLHQVFADIDRKIKEESRPQHFPEN
jgi:hypothetical protein